MDLQDLPPKLPPSLALCLYLLMPSGSAIPANDCSTLALYSADNRMKATENRYAHLTWYLAFRITPYTSSSSVISAQHVNP